MKKFNFEKIGSTALLIMMIAYAVLSGNIHTQFPAQGQANAFACNGQTMTEAQIAAYRGISLETLQWLKARFNVSPADICTLSQTQFDKAVLMVEDLESADPRLAQSSEEQEMAEELERTNTAEQPNLQFLRTRLQDENGDIPLDGLVKAKEQMDAMAEIVDPSRDAGIVSNGWTWLGPGNIGGRTRAFVIDPIDPNIIYAGTASGGVWKTTDAGANWFPLDDFMGVLGIESLVMDPNDHNILYAGTGEVFQGNGVFKTTDAGITWTQLSATNTSDWYQVREMAITATSPTTTLILAATDSGIWKSTDDGGSWTLTSSALVMGDIEINPNDTTKAIASSLNTDVLYSTDSGSSWTAASFSGGTLNTGKPLQVEYARSDPNIIYGATKNQVWKSTDGGANYSLIHTDATIWSDEWFDGLWVDPTDPDHVIIGSQDNWRSFDGGATFARISEWWNWPVSAHADNHFIVEDRGFNGTTNTTVYVAGDGGMFRTDDIYSVTPTSGWVELSNNFGATQFYSGAGSAATGQVIGGTQDAGTLSYTVGGGTEGWTTITGGDGGFTAIDPIDPTYWYGEYVNLTGLVRKGTDAIDGSYWNGSATVWKNPPYRIEDSKNETANFIAPFILDPNNPARMLAGGQSLWRTNNVKAAVTSTTGPVWDEIFTPGVSDYWNNISAISVTPGNSDIIWIGDNDGDVWMTTNGTAASPSWTEMDDTAGFPDRFVGRITIDPDNNSKVYVVFGGYSADNVWLITTDGGSGVSSSSDITGSGLTGLPDLPIYSLVIHPNNANWLYVGTELGIFTSENGGADWALPQDGPVNTGVEELFWLDNTLVAATHGRGFFKADTDAPSVDRITGTPTSVNSVDFTVSFNKTVTGVDLSDFILTTTGSSSGTLSGLSGSGNSYTVTVTSISGAGSLRLDLPLSASVEDIFATALTGLPFTGGQKCIVSAAGVVCPTMVANKNNAGAGSLRQAIADATAGSTIAFDPTLNGQTIFLGSPLVIDKDITIDGSMLTTKLTLSGDTDNNGAGNVRVITVNSGVTAKINGLTITKGYSGWGGGINNEGTLTVTNSTFISNNAPAGNDGGAIWNNGTLTVANSTFSGNTASNVGGAIYSGGTLTLLNSTLSGNSADWGGGIAINGASHLKNNIIANSTGGDCGEWTAPATNVRNLIEDNSCSPTYHVDPKLAPLAYNGGPTKTFALMTGSAAINNGYDAACAASPISNRDQRGYIRPQSTHCDIGAYEGTFAERAKNGGFNTYTSTSKIPKYWVKNSAFATTDGKDTTVKKEGTASVKIAGQPAKTKTLTQTITLSGKTGEFLTFSFWAKGASIPAAGACKAEVLLYSGTTLKETKTINCKTGTYAAFQKKTLSFNAAYNFTKVVIKFTYAKSKGTIWFDGVSLLK